MAQRGRWWGFVLAGNVAPFGSLILGDYTPKTPLRILWLNVLINTLTRRSSYVKVWKHIGESCADGATLGE